MVHVRRLVRWILLGAIGVSGSAAELRVVPQLDLKRYEGKWFEVARLPNRFQKKCAGDVTATYTLRPDGKITVLNECRESNGAAVKAKGTAKLADAKGPNSKLKVTFFWPFYGDYWVMDLDQGYQWAAVGAPDRKYFWVLSRTPELPEETMRGILDRARQQGYQLDSLLRTKQSR